MTWRCRALPPGSSIARDELPPADVDDPMIALNEAMCVDAHTLAVADGATIEGPIEIVHLAIAEDARSLYSRFAISLGVGASASFVETFVGAGHGAQRNSLTIIMLAEGAKAKHIVVVEDNPDLHIESQIAQLASRA